MREAKLAFIGSVPLTKSAALRPSRPIRISSGPSARKEKPRAGSSSCAEENAEIERNTGKLRDAERRDQPLHFREAALDQGKAAGIELCHILAARHGGGIAVERDDAARRAAQHRFAVAAGAESTVEIETVIVGLQRGDHFGEQDGDMCARLRHLTGSSVKKASALA